MVREHRLNTSIVLAAVYGLSGLFRAVSAVEPITLSPSHSVPVPNRSSRLRGRKSNIKAKLDGGSENDSGELLTAGCARLCWLQMW